MTNLNYSNQNLQNRSFKKQNLDSADFSGSDLRGCDFSGATLIKANFQQVKTGQSQRQTKILVIATIASPLVLFGSSIIFVNALNLLLSEKAFNFFFGALPLLAFVIEFFFKNTIIYCFPKLTNFLGIGAVTTLFTVMVILTICLALMGFTSFSDNILQGLFLLLLMLVSGIISSITFKWVIQSIQSYPGTSFRKANLTDADFSHSHVENTDFSYALLTGICVFAWVNKAYNQFTNIKCQYLYLEPDYQNRQPVKGDFKANELSDFFYQFMNK